jgi:hypothetical protein
VTDLARADGLNKAITTLIAERDLVGRLPTWPWQRETLGTVDSALAMPVLLWLITRFLGQFV